MNDCALKEGSKIPRNRSSSLDNQSSVKQHTTASLLAEQRDMLKFPLKYALSFNQFTTVTPPYRSSNQVNPS